MREAIEELGVTRIQHGVRAIEDPSVVKLAIDRDVTFDVCPISNIGLKATTNEGTDEIGRSLAIAAHAVVLIAKI